MKLPLCDFIPQTLAERGTMSWEALLLHCADWTSEKFVRSTVERLVRDQRIGAITIGGCPFYQPLSEMRGQTRTTPSQVLEGDIADIVEMLSKGPLASELLRDRLCIASHQRFARALSAAMRRRLIIGQSQQYRLAGQPKALLPSSLDAVYRGRRAGAVS